MGLWDAFSEIVEVVTPWTVVEAEAPAAAPQEEETIDNEPKDEGAAEESSEESNQATEDADKEEEKEDGEEEEEEEEEEEDEEEIVDPKVVLEEACKNSAQCAPAKHHFEECAARVAAQEEAGEKVKEDCVEEFFHLTHCASTCAASKLWSKLR